MKVEMDAESSAQDGDDADLQLQIWLNQLDHLALGLENCGSSSSGSGGGHIVPSNADAAGSGKSSAAERLSRGLNRQTSAGSSSPTPCSQALMRRPLSGGSSSSVASSSSAATENDINGADFPLPPPPPDELDSHQHRGSFNSYRYSIVNMEESQDVDLDAILGELNALDSQFEEALQSTKVIDKEGSMVSDGKSRDSYGYSTASATSGGGRTHSPDNDSAFSDCVSLLSSESTCSGGNNTTVGSNNTSFQSMNGVDNGVTAASQTKAEKIKLALQKMKEASVKKLFVKVFNRDGSAKCLLVDEGMTVGYVTRILAEKNHIPLDPKLALIEQLVELNMERVYEDNEPLVDQLMEWSRHSTNRLVFDWRPAERTALFTKPAMLLAGTTPAAGTTPSSVAAAVAASMAEPQVPTGRGEESQQNTTVADVNSAQSFNNNKILEEFFSGSGVPSLEGPLYLKTDSKKGWKRYHFMLRASGLYYWPKDKAKSSSKDLICLNSLTNNQVYYGVGWKKKYKAPTDFGFALKHPAIQQLTNKSAKFIKYLCTDDRDTLLKWVTAVRLVKCGRQLYVNYKAVLEESLSIQTSNGMTQVCDVPAPGCSDVSDSGSSSSGCDMALETDFPHGTIKRKPPKLPLTATTRQLKEIAIGSPVAEEVDNSRETRVRLSTVASNAIAVEDLPPPPPELLEPPSMEYPEPPPPPPPPRQLPRHSNMFLQDLARVMSKKWQVAEKCKVEDSGEVLGFRDPGSDYYSSSRESRASKWVEEHYGTSPAAVNPPAVLLQQRAALPPPPPPMYENVYNKDNGSAVTQQYPNPDTVQQQVYTTVNEYQTTQYPPPPSPSTLQLHQMAEQAQLYSTAVEYQRQSLPYAAVQMPPIVHQPMPQNHCNGDARHDLYSTIPPVVAAQHYSQVNGVAASILRTTRRPPPPPPRAVTTQLTTVVQPTS